MVNVFPDPAPATTKVFYNDFTASNCFSFMLNRIYNYQMIVNGFEYAGLYILYKI